MHFFCISSICESFFQITHIRYTYGEIHNSVVELHFHFQVYMICLILSPIGFHPLQISEKRQIDYYICIIIFNWGFLTVNSQLTQSVLRIVVILSPLLLSRVKMVKYEVTVSTGNLVGATTFNNIFIKLVGTDGESERKWLKSIKGAASFIMGTVSPSLFQCIRHFLNFAFMRLLNTNLEKLI